jgi:hypothetical protein
MDQLLICSLLVNHFKRFFGASLMLTTSINYPGEILDCFIIVRMKIGKEFLTAINDTNETCLSGEYDTNEAYLLLSTLARPYFCLDS